MKNDSLQESLEHVLSHLPPELHPTPEILTELIQQARTYWDLLSRWNAKIKLTGAQTLADFAHRHLADSLMGLGVLGALGEQGHCLDVGAGAGFPSIPLALARPELQWTLAESHQRRAAFLQELQRKLKLPQVQIKSARVGGSPPSEGFLERGYRSILFRAVSPEELLPVAEAYLHPEGKIIYWGTQPSAPTHPETLKLVQEFPYDLVGGEAFALYVFRLV